MSLGRSTSFSFGQPGSGAGGGFGVSAQKPNNAGPSFSFGGQQQQQQQQPQQQQTGTGSSLFSFGQPQQQQQQQQQQPSNSLFGQQQPQQQQQKPTLTLGQPSTGFGSSLFGQQQQQPQQAATGGLFGGGGASSTASKSIFGFGQAQSTAQQQPQQTQQGGGFSFGATAPAQQQQQQHQSLQQQQNVGGLFGQSKPSAPMQNAFGASVNPSSPFARQAFHQKERFNDLSEENKKLFEEMDKYITAQLRLKDELMAREYGSEVKRRAAEWSELTNGVNNTLLILQQDGDLIKGIVDDVERDRTDLATLYEIAQNYKDGKGDGKQWAAWPGDFFAKAALKFRERIKRYRSTIEEIERQLATIDTRNEHSPQLISDAIVHQNAVFMSLASNVAELHAEVDQLKRHYVQWYQQQFRSVRDPFAMSQLTATI